jgi:hypothetical protein
VLCFFIACAEPVRSLALAYDETVPVKRLAVVNLTHESPFDHTATVIQALGAQRSNSLLESGLTRCDNCAPIVSVSGTIAEI